MLRLTTSVTKKYRKISTEVKCKSFHCSFYTTYGREIRQRDLKRRCDLFFTVWISMWQQELVKSIRAERPIWPELIPISVPSGYFSTSSWKGCYNLGQHKKRQEPPFPRSNNEDAKEQKRAILASMKRGKGWPRYSIYFVQDCNLKGIQRNNKPPSPPPKQWWRCEWAKSLHFWIIEMGEGLARCSLCFVLGQNEKKRINPLSPTEGAKTRNFGIVKMGGCAKCFIYFVQDWGQSQGYPQR